MAVEYQCRHCGHKIGRLEQSVVDMERLGLHTLSNEEKKDMVNYLSDGNIQVTAICEHCEEALSRNPHYYEMDYFIQ
ncbi:anti-sigma-F factor Fin family protein [Salirhabdus sp. Marseille-P4669]|uniref:anti-sigma-F factor Fin family protein n=1 Tax=Salirhabdus sp. Marseille-P4669 TaxID=2042310 RepID=UPI000C7DDB0A|nr:anti-sigma-F factor Fin family protein [Salirhabdus sp. Marseille-P4669]